MLRGAIFIPIIFFFVWFPNESFESTNQISEGECQVDENVEGNIITYEGCYDTNTHLFSDCIKNEELLSNIKGIGPKTIEKIKKLASKLEKADG